MAGRLTCLFLASAVQTALASESWCGWIPVSVQAEVAGCTEGPMIALPTVEGCVDWCKWVPVLGMMHIEECLLCVNVTDLPNVIGSNHVPPANTGLVVNVHLGAEHPDWCSWLPGASRQFVPACAGSGTSSLPAPFVGPDCQGWCQWVPEFSWQDPPGCRGCLPTEQPVLEPVPATGDIVEDSTTSPFWCRLVPPMMLQYVDECSGYAGPPGFPVPGIEGCTYWCVWISGPAWKDVHECHHCSAASGAIDNETGGTGSETNNTESEVTGEANATSAGETTEALSPTRPTSHLRGRNLQLFPDWCRWVPAGSLQYVPDCVGYGYGPMSPPQARCESWCVWVPRPSWQYPPGCRGCA
mmetsp:Transcript_1256/g.2308  ORF Transcript_1256/g.2308 Transcript_1256/m.2308 type:complete len:355 (+) Transcript_1256:66-1130(+)